MNEIAGVPFKLGEAVKIKISGEEGLVVGLSIHSYGGPNACVHYVAGDGRAIESWWAIDLLEPA